MTEIDIPSRRLILFAAFAAEAGALAALVAARELLRPAAVSATSDAPAGS